MDISRNKYSTTEMDLGLLIECLNFQMECPESQKRALHAIYTICQDREDYVDLLREMGGLAFLCSLTKSSIVHPDVKETALFTIGMLAEANVYFKTQLCQNDTFSHLASLLTTPESPVPLLRVSVYLLSVLVANNKLGQTFAQNTGCLDNLLEIFRSSFPFETSDENPVPLNFSQMYQLWTSVANALCGCINNPQNEVAQRISVAAYPLVKDWLQRITVPRPEMFRPLCFFIAMSVSNNAYTQESFSASGSLETLTRTLVRLTADADKSLLCCQIAVIITRTLSSCITDNAVSVRVLAQYGLVPQLVSLLSSTHLDGQDRLPVLLTLGNCTEASGEHQLQLVQCGGLPVIITLLTECPTEELRRAATFILQTCKQATMTLQRPAPAEDCEEAGAFTIMDAHWKSASELLHRIRQLETGQQYPTDTTRGQDGGMWRESLAEEENQREFPPERSGQRGDPPCCWWDFSPGTPQRSLTEDMHEEEEERQNTQGHVRRNLFTSDKEANLHRVVAECEQEDIHGLPQKDPGYVGHVHHQPSESRADRCCDGSPSVDCPNTVPRGQALGSSISPDVLCSMCKGTGNVTSEMAPPDGAREPHTDRQVLNLRVPIIKSMKKGRKWISDKDALSLCSDLIDNEIRQLNGGPGAVAQHVAHVGERCSGCVLPFEAVTSRTFWSLQSSCRHSCDMHKVLQEASNAFRARRTLFRRKKPGGAVVTAHTLGDTGEEVQQGQGGGRRGREAGTSSLMVTGRRHDDEDTAHIGQPNTKPDREAASSQRHKNNFTHEEVKYLLNGVKKYGYSWNSILWSYPFRPGRTNVSLAKMYRQLKITAN